MKYYLGINTIFTSSSTLLQSLQGSRCARAHSLGFGRQVRLQEVSPSLLHQVSSKLQARLYIICGLSGRLNLGQRVKHDDNYAHGISQNGGLPLLQHLQDHIGQPALHLLHDCDGIASVSHAVQALGDLLAAGDGQGLIEQQESEVDIAVEILVNEGEAGGHNIGECEQQIPGAALIAVGRTGRTRMVEHGAQHLRGCRQPRPELLEDERVAAVDLVAELLVAAGKHVPNEHSRATHDIQYYWSRPFLLASQHLANTNVDLCLLQDIKDRRIGLFVALATSENTVDQLQEFHSMLPIENKHRGDIIQHLKAQLYNCPFYLPAFAVQLIHAAQVLSDADEDRANDELLSLQGPPDQKQVPHVCFKLAQAGQQKPVILVQLRNPNPDWKIVFQGAADAHQMEVALFHGLVLSVLLLVCSGVTFAHYLLPLEYLLKDPHYSEHLPPSLKQFACLTLPIALPFSIA